MFPWYLQRCYVVEHVALKDIIASFLVFRRTTCFCNTIHQAVRICNTIHQAVRICNTIHQAVHICKDHEYNVSIIKKKFFFSSNSSFIPLPMCDKDFNFDVYVYILSTKLHILIFIGTVSCIIKWIIIDSTWTVGDVHIIDLVTYMYFIDFQGGFSIESQLSESPISFLFHFVSYIWLKTA